MCIGTLINLNIDLTNRCNKNCWICGRREREKENPEIIKTYGDMDFELVKLISKQVPSNIVVQFHNNGESLLYPRFGEALKLFPRNIKNIVSNGKLLLDKFDEIVDNLDSIAISIIENDPESEKQYEVVKEFLAKKGDKKPYVIARCNGDVPNIKRYEDLGLKIAYRILHHPMGSFDYIKKNPTIPEIGICWDLLYHLAINKNGDVSICPRFDPNGLGVLGNIKDTNLNDLFNSNKRKEWVKDHLKGRRDLVPFCSNCDYWGIPTGE